MKFLRQTHGCHGYLEAREVPGKDELPGCLVLFFVFFGFFFPPSPPPLLFFFLLSASSSHHLNLGFPSQLSQSGVSVFVAAFGGVESDRRFSDDSVGSSFRAKMSYPRVYEGQLSLGVSRPPGHPSPGPAGSRNGQRPSPSHRGSVGKVCWGLGSLGVKKRPSYVRSESGGNWGRLIFF